jgi:hypothetical protein
MGKSEKEAISLHDLYPQLNEEELREAEENLRLYLALTLRIFERIQSDPEAYSRFKALTASGQDPRMGGERSSPP